MTILLTGARGLLGTELLRVLADKYTVIPLTRAQADLADEQATRAALSPAGRGPDWVVHAAAWTDVDGCQNDPPRAFRQNSEATRHVAAACRSLGSSLLYLSTDYVFNGRQREPYTEDNSPDPLSVYGASKLAGERHVAELGAAGCIVRTAWLFGRARANFVEDILQRGERGEPVRVIADQVGSPTYAVDLAEKLAQLIERRAAGLYHVVNQGAVSRHQVALWLAERLGWPREQITPVSGASLAGRAPRPAYSALTSVRLAAVGLAPLRPWQEALADYLAARARAGEPAAALARTESRPPDTR
jgi:dTDP-4-dehydrorhamnose reductase